MLIILFINLFSYRKAIFFNSTAHHRTPYKEVVEESGDYDDDADVQHSFKGYSTLQPGITSSAAASNRTYVLDPAKSFLAKSVNLDDRPITPMKNRMVYDVRHSTLDFKDGQ